MWNYLVLFVSAVPVIHPSSLSHVSAFLVAISLYLAPRYHFPPSDMKNHAMFLIQLEGHPHLNWWLCSSVHDSAIMNTFASPFMQLIMASLFAHLCCCSSLLPFMNLMQSVSFSQVFPFRLVDAERDYLSLTKRYPRLVISPDVSKVCCCMNKFSFQLGIIGLFPLISDLFIGCLELAKRKP